jgi:hypothetical protein
MSANKPMKTANSPKSSGLYRRVISGAASTVSSCAPAVPPTSILTLRAKEFFGNKPWANCLIRLVNSLRSVPVNTDMATDKIVYVGFLYDPRVISPRQRDALQVADIAF